MQPVTWVNRLRPESLLPPMAGSVGRPGFSAPSRWEPDQGPPRTVRCQDRLPNVSQQLAGFCRGVGKQPSDLVILVGVAGFEPQQAPPSPRPLNGVLTGLDAGDEAAPVVAG